ncbi:DUF948 domain-containing protein [Peribacillus cavernae]|uniref:DUF948 domain-containing protein n=1 Tax=Peribacillus cavernae TaxID=1674310 RepID=A0A3S1B3X2_9BACI|nr:DUF948 domain-containing protein [Peribacillus cavernae]MDQ0220514.1 uncharacterized protein YoxC [Peribacillus cavernae]RUQ27995.1 DUF948 domain-containing protein [Peribacillus cavernae]
MLIEFSIAAIAIAFIWLVVFLIGLLQKGMVTLGETNRTLDEVRNAVHGLTEESRELIHTANQITVDVKHKMQTVDPLLESAQDVGDVIHNITNSVKQATNIRGNGAPPHANTTPPNPKRNIR